MKIGIFDLETSGLYANFGIILCCSSKPYEHSGVTTIRADDFPAWKTDRTNQLLLTTRIVNELRKYDILVAHNGQYFDKAWINTLSMKYDFDADIRWKKFIDPVLIARRHLRMGRNSLDQLLDYFEVPNKKSHVSGRMWMAASLNGDRKAMDEIVRHCEADVKALEGVYNKVRKLVERIDNRGSA
jgi:uncharacterized protein YprB with RNaseH-like and TPR domain